jgi:two-component system nitrogen regulation response regulator GlnG
VQAERTLTVLLVDDDDSWRASLERWLSALGMRSVGLAEATPVAEAIAAHHPDVVLLDVHLPHADGLRVLADVRARWPALPVVVMTAFGGRETEARARDAGATGYLDKPFRMEQLAAHVFRAIHGCAPPRDRGEHP